MTRRERLREIIFESGTPAGKAFDVGLLIAILASILAVMLDSIASVRQEAGPVLRAFEWIFTLLFTAEYLARLAAVERPGRYARSFFGIVDLVSILPSYLSLLIPGAESLLVIRGLRLLRVFRVFKLARFLGEQNLLMTSLRQGSTKIYVFLATVLILDLILGTAMYFVEGAQNGFTSIPIALYWAIVTTTTVGYGDISPVTSLGRVISSVAMLVGYTIIAVPTGIVTAEIIDAARRPENTRTCPHCMSEGHLLQAGFCRDCGGRLAETSP